MTSGGVAAADFWATLSIHIDSHGRDRVDAVDIGADQIALTHSLPLSDDKACGLSVLSGNKARVLVALSKLFVTPCLSLVAVLGVEVRPSSGYRTVRRTPHNNTPRVSLSLGGEWGGPGDRCGVPLYCDIYRVTRFRAAVSGQDGRGQGQRDLGLHRLLHPCLHWLRGGPRQHLEVPLPVSAEWRR